MTDPNLQPRAETHAAQPPVPLVCDLDGTLIRTDITFELCLLHLMAHPISGWWRLLSGFLSDKAATKDMLARAHGDGIAIDGLPYSDVLDHEMLAGYDQRALVSGSADMLVTRVAEDHGAFLHVQGSDRTRSLTGEAKAAYLKQEFPDGYDYVGDALVDVPVWRDARKAFAYNASDATVKAAQEHGINLERLNTRPSEMPALWKGMRPHQWSKNGLLFVTPLLNVSLFEASWIVYLLLGLIAFCMVTSATYLLNDLLDLEADRVHATKRNRPFASGALSIPTGGMATVGLGLGGLVLALLVGAPFFACLLIYAVCSLLYSFKLKKIAVFDTMVLSFLFCWRVIAGGVLLGLSNSVWFLAAIGFFFLSLALGKRAIELNRAKVSATVLSGRGYRVEDLDVVKTSGLAASFVMSVIVLIYALMEQSTVITRDVSAVIIAVTFLFWQLRFWLLVGRDEVHDDPIIFALKDRTSALVLFGIVVAVMYEQLVPAAG
ncbi:MAG: UbiA family prenyltransferase [Pseudomonadota bacterium]